MTRGRQPGEDESQAGTKDSSKREAKRIILVVLGH